MAISSPCLTDIKNCKELASTKQTSLGKDFSNLLIVDSLLKTIWLSMHHVVTMKHWLFQSKQLLEFGMGGGTTGLDESLLYTADIEYGLGDACDKKAMHGCPRIKKAFVMKTFT
ncbi:hypothetical protein Tco_1004892 [Tanacetum coccineum]|uniref:Uncharacterized protein n=1 Tax=Tanacetum coccineum TaxID=301880 RepID=A0ABQ5FE81_9ASTR